MVDNLYNLNVICKYQRCFDHRYYVIVLIVRIDILEYNIQISSAIFVYVDM